MRIDKNRSVNYRKRISEKTLLWHALVFGSLGILLGMYYASHHKTQVWKFKLGVPSILILEIAGFAYIYIRFFQTA